MFNDTDTIRLAAEAVSGPFNPPPDLENRLIAEFGLPRSQALIAIQLGVVMRRKKIDRAIGEARARMGR